MIRVISAFSLTILVIALAHSACAEEQTLEELQKAFDSAPTQTEMNLASGRIADYTDSKLRLIEQKIVSQLDGEGLERFNENTVAFRVYRKSQTALIGTRYHGGSIQPMAYNLVFAELTLERIAQLEELLPESP